MTFPIGPREVERLKALHDLRILDTPPEEQFDAVCRTAQRLFQVPIALVSLIEQDRQWFKARCGLNVDGTSREVSFCTYAILSDEVFVVEDATRDPRFAANPLVTAEPHIRFYAGAPLVVAPGIHVGTFCLIDAAPRSFSPGDREALRDLGTIVVAHLRLHKAKVDSDDEARIRRANEELIRRQKSELDVQEQRLSLTLQNMNQGLIMLDGESTVQVYNRRACELLELPPAFLAAKPDVRALSEQLAHELLPETLHAPDTRERLHAGAVIEIASVPVEGGGAVVTYTDITQRKHAERLLEYQARHDPLTDLPNRVYFRERLQQQLAEVRRHGGIFALFCMDLDRFKAVNDTLGHPAGDSLLRQVSRRLLDALREEDTLARFGGDEFALLQVGLNQPDGAEALAQRLIREIEEPFEIDGQAVSIGLSIGIAVAPICGLDPDLLLKQADLALYAAKAGGRGTYRVSAG